DYITVGCDYLGTQMVRLWVIDESGSFDFCDVLLVVQNNMGGCGDISNSNSSITGNIENELNESVQQVQVKAELENGQMLNYITNATGAYAFATALGQRVVVQPTKDVDDMNGISTLDLVKIQKHILAKEALANQYREIAADINNDGRISSLDLVHLRKLILGKVDELSDSDSWRFFSTLNNQEKYTIDPLDEAMRLDWVAVKIGDINLDHDPSRAADRSGNNLVFNVDDFSMNVGSQYAIDVRANNFNDIAGYQYTLKFDPAAFDVTNIKMAEGLGLNDENFALNRVGQGAITTSWNHFEGISVDPETVLFTLIIEAKKAVALSEAMTINSSVTPAEAYNSQDQISDIALNFNSEAVAPNEFVLLQNRPNPFTDATAVGFHLPEATNITLTVFDVTGKVVHVRTGDFAKGYNEILIKKKELTASGVLYYQLDSETYTATKKMIHVK
ncbi:MAG: dockerin type I domain-containing protein, partial [Saprospiraceae bacterium]|nr:dockerin type I domain-containing protein [Saprospiraceae bacterium]